MNIKTPFLLQLWCRPKVLCHVLRLLWGHLVACMAAVAIQLSLEKGWRDSVGFPMQSRDQCLAAYLFIYLFIYLPRLHFSFPVEGLRPDSNLFEVYIEESYGLLFLSGLNKPFLAVTGTALASSFKHAVCNVQDVVNHSTNSYFFLCIYIIYFMSCSLATEHPGLPRTSAYCEHCEHKVMGTPLSARHGLSCNGLETRGWSRAHTSFATPLEDSAISSADELVRSAKAEHYRVQLVQQSVPCIAHCARMAHVTPRLMRGEIAVLFEAGMLPRRSTVLVVHCREPKCQICQMPH